MTSCAESQPRLSTYLFSNSSFYSPRLDTLVRKRSQALYLLQTFFAAPHNRSNSTTSCTGIHIPPRASTPRGINMATAHEQQQQQRRPSTISSFIRWLKLKNYQYEVTFSLYMLSPTERVIFSSCPLLPPQPAYS